MNSMQKYFMIFTVMVFSSISFAAPTNAVNIKNEIDILNMKLGQINSSGVQNQDLPKYLLDLKEEILKLKIKASSKPEREKKIQMYNDFLLNVVSTKNEARGIRAGWVDKWQSIFSESEVAQSFILEQYSDADKEIISNLLSRVGKLNSAENGEHSCSVLYNFTQGFKASRLSPRWNEDHVMYEQAGSSELKEAMYSLKRDSFTLAIVNAFEKKCMNEIDTKKPYLYSSNREGYSLQQVIYHFNDLFSCFKSASCYQSHVKTRGDDCVTCGPNATNEVTQVSKLQKDIVLILSTDTVKKESGTEVPIEVGNFRGAKESMTAAVTFKSTWQDPLVFTNTTIKNSKGKIVYNHSSSETTSEIYEFVDVPLPGKSSKGDYTMIMECKLKSGKKHTLKKTFKVK